MLSMTANGFTEARTYNSNLQLTDLISGANVHSKYNYSASQNNGQILSQQDLVSRETIGYQYDLLKRLTQANGTGDPSGSWQQNFDDGFGNLTNNTSTNAPQLSVAVANPVNPQSWNRYSYSSNDPVNEVDPSGLCSVIIGGITESSSNTPGINDFATAIQGVIAYPFAGTNLVNGVETVSNLGSQNIPASEVAYEAILSAAANNAGPIDIFTFSGGAAAFSNAYGRLPSSIQARINNVSYVSPGVIGSLPSFPNHTSAFVGTGVSDMLISSNIPFGTPVYYDACEHNEQCQFGAQAEYRALLELLSTGACSNPGTISAPPPTGITGTFVNNSSGPLERVSSTITVPVIEAFPQVVFIPSGTASSQVKRYLLPL